MGITKLGEIYNSNKKKQLFFNLTNIPNFASKKMSKGENRMCPEFFYTLICYKEL